MNALSLTTSARMTSKEIAELVEKRHDSVKRTIKTLAENGVIQLPQIVEVEDKQSLSPNSKSKAYIFDADHKRDTYVVVAQLSPEFTARIVDRWQELESGKSSLRILDPALAAIAQTLVELDQVKQKQVQTQQQVDALEGRVDQMDGETGYMTVTAYLRTNGVKLPLSEAQRFGKLAARTAKDLGVQLGSVPDERWGSVNSYPIELLDEIAGEFLGLAA